MALTPEDLALFGIAPEPREPGSDDGDPTPVAVVAGLIEAVNSPNPQVVGKLHVTAPGFNPSVEVLPPDAPPNDANTPPPEKKKRGKKAKTVAEVVENSESTGLKLELELGAAIMEERKAKTTVEPFEDIEAQIAHAKAKEDEWNAKVAELKERETVPEPVSVHAKPPHAVEDGPGWVMVTCSVCGHEIGKRPAGHSISPALCPNKTEHGKSGQIPDSDTVLAFQDRLLMNQRRMDPRLIARALRAAADVLEQG